jgi:hypothetical protein
MKLILKRLCLAFLIAAAVYITFVTIKMVQISNHSPKPDASSMIILGAKLNGDSFRCP